MATAKRRRYKAAQIRAQRAKVEKELAKLIRMASDDILDDVLSTIVDKEYEVGELTDQLDEIADLVRNHLNKEAHND